jgi:hypothetical protein
MADGNFNEEFDKFKDNDEEHHNADSYDNLPLGGKATRLASVTRCESIKTLFSVNFESFGLYVDEFSQ